MKVYISNYLSHSISIIDYETLEMEREIVLDNNIYPHHFCVDEDEGKIYIPSLVNGTLYEVDIISGKILNSISVGGSLSQIFMHGDELFVSNEDTNSIYIINKYTLEAISMISVDDMPHGLGYDQKNNKLYVPCINSIICIDIENKIIYKKIDTDFKAWHLEVDEKKKEIYVSTLDGKLVILKEDDLEIINTFYELLLPVQIRFNYIDERVYISDLGYNQIKILDYRLGKYIGKIKVNGIPQGLEISKDYSRLFVSDTENDEIKVYDTKTNQLIKAIHVGKEPTTIVCL
ncbi:MAG: YncE family protein [Clostridiales bacterium]|uniref:YncE family protein n=1 Tax=Clostridia TaxID=186801 RepID=UPI0018AB6A60|nr:YncE family protein [Clostridium sp. 1001270J_160509_D11]MDU1202799.1 YncE family protein [Clostridiales bacterium]